MALPLGRQPKRDAPIAYLIITERAKHRFLFGWLFAARTRDIGAALWGRVS